MISRQGTEKLFSIGFEILGAWSNRPKICRNPVTESSGMEILESAFRNFWSTSGGCLFSPEMWKFREFSVPLGISFQILARYAVLVPAVIVKWRAWWKKGVSDDLRLKSKLLLFSWTLAHRLVFMWGTLLRTYFLTWDLKFEELAYYFCLKLTQRKQQDRGF